MSEFHRNFLNPPGSKVFLAFIWTLISEAILATLKGKGTSPSSVPVNGQKREIPVGCLELVKPCIIACYPLAYMASIIKLSKIHSGVQVPVVPCE